MTENRMTDLSTFSAPGGQARVIEIADEFRSVIEQRDKTKKPWAVSIGGGKHITIEAWQYLGQRVGLVTRTVETEFLTDGDVIGYRCACEVQRVDTGETIGRAEQVCWSDEVQRKRNGDLYVRWEGPDGRPQRHAILGMAQTRAQSRALASVLRFIAEMAGVNGTPAEEMDGVQSGGKKSDKPRPKQKSTDGDISNPYIGTIEGVTTKSGKTGNKSWTLNIIRTVDGPEFTTFDKKVIEQIKELGKGIALEMHWSVGKKEGQKTLEGVDPHIETTPEPDQEETETTEEKDMFGAD